MQTNLATVKCRNRWCVFRHKTTI